MKNPIKKLTAMLLAAVMLVTCVPAVSVNAQSYLDFKVADSLIVTAVHGVYVRTGYGPDAPVLTALPCGSHVTVNAILPNSWMEVVYGTATDGTPKTGYADGREGYFTKYTDPTVVPYSPVMQAVVLANALNVHSTPVESYSNVIDDLSVGQAVNATGYTSNGLTQVSYYRGTTPVVGYVSSYWIRLEATANTTYTTPEQFTTISGYSAQVKSNCKGLNVRVSPSDNANILTVIYAGDVVNVLAESDHWYKVSLNYKGQMETGYIYKSYTKKIDAMSNLRLSKTSVSIKKGKKYHLLIRGNTGMELTTKWTSSNKKVAKVSKRGYVAAKKKGSATITCKITVGDGNTKKTVKLKCKVLVK